jgi:hypothetical protein
VQDTNTPKDKSADIGHIERLWKNRFGLDKAILERLHIILSDHESWQYNKSDMPHYHKVYPEFHIEYPELEYYQDTGEYEPNDITHQIYSGFYIKSKASWYPYQIFYHSTLLHDSAYHYFDETRIILSNYKTGFIGPETFAYYYFEKDSIEGKILRLIMKRRNNRNYCCSPHDESDYCPQCSDFGSGAFLVFDSQYRRKMFEKYVVDNFDVFDSIDVSLCSSGAIHHAKENGWADNNVESMFRLYQMLIKWGTGDEIYQ